MALRNNQTERGEELLKQFVHEQGFEGTVHDLQTCWYEIEVGKAFLRQNNFVRGLRFLAFVEKTFADVYEDQVHHIFLLHSNYCLSLNFSFSPFASTL